MGEKEDRERLRYLELKAKATASAEPDSASFWFNENSKPKGRLDPESSYYGAEDKDLNFAQKAERKLGDWGLVKPGRELFSPKAVDEKTKALATAGDTAILGYGPQVAGAAELATGGDYLKGRDKAKKYLDSVEGGTKAIGTTVGMIPWLMTGGGGGSGPLKTAGQTWRGAVKSGAAFGALQNPGDVEGELSPLQLAPRLKNAAKGGVVAGVIAAPFAAVQKLREVLSARKGANADDVVRIAKQLGIPEEQIPTEMLTQDETVRRKAAALSKSPTLGGGMQRRGTRPFDETIHNTAEGLVADAAGATEDRATLGARLKEEIPKEVDKKLAPSIETLDRIQPNLEKTAPRGVSMKSGTTRLSNEIVPKDSDGMLRGIIDREKEHFQQNIKSVSDLKEWRTSLQQKGSAARAKGDSLTAGVYDNLADIAQREADRSMLREGIKSGSKIGREAKKGQLVRDWQGARKDYAQNAEELSAALGSTRRGTRGVKGQARDFLDTKTVDELPEYLMGGKDTERSDAFSKAFPDQWEQIRKHKLSQIAGAAEGPSGVISAPKLDTQLGKLKSPGMEEKLLGKNAGVTKDWRTLMNAVPDPNYNPSRSGEYIEQFGKGPMKQLHSVGDAAELNLRRPMEFVKRGGKLEQAANNTQVARPLISAISSRVGRPPTSEEGKQRVMTRVRGTKYEGPLAQASERGPDAFAANYFLMSQTYPDFRSLLEDDEPEI